MSSPEKKVSILVVEDSLTQAIRLEMLLQEAGYSVLRVESAEDALKVLQEKSPDLVVSDITMPGITGFELCRRIKEDPKHQGIPVMLLTNLADPNDVIHGLDARADGYVTKPYQDQFLLEQVESILQAPTETFVKEKGLEIDLAGTTHTITANRQQLLNLFLSTYRNAIIQNRQLEKKQLELNENNAQIQRHVEALSNSERRFRQLVETIPDIVYRLDHLGHFVFLNDAITHLGYQKDELIGHHFSILIHTEDLERVSRDRVVENTQRLWGKEEPKLFDERRTGQRRTIGLEVRVRLKDSGSNTVPAEIHSFGIDHEPVIEVNSSGLYEHANGEHLSYIGTVGVIRDISDRIQVQRELEKQRLSAELLAREADQANKAKSAFVANMSHEIRTPMNAIIGLTDLLFDTPLEEQQQNYLDKIHQSSNSLLAIINDILDFSKIEANHLELEKSDFSINALIEEVAGMLALPCAKKGIDLLIDIDINLPRLIEGDPLRLRQVLINLVNNAVKFTSQGEVIIRVNRQESTRQEPLIRFGVIDSGIGIPQQQQQHLMQPFSQADSSTTRRYGGTGLGLSISSRLVKLMGGTLQFDSQESKGSQFCFTLPLMIVSHSADSKVSLPTLAAKNRELILIESNPETQRHLSQMLRTLGFLVNPYSNLQEATQHLQRRTSSLVVIGHAHEESPTVDSLLQQIDNQHQLSLLLVDRAGNPLDSEWEPWKTQQIQHPILISQLHHSLSRLMGISPAASERKELNPKNKTPHFSGQRLLVFEDNEINQLVIKEILEKFNLQVEIAINGEEGIARIKEMIDSEELCDLVLMDIQMPLLDGFQATQIIRHELKLTELPIIAMTANAMQEDAQRCLQAGMNDHLGKPLNKKRLQELLIHYLDSRINITEQTQVSAQTINLIKLSPVQEQFKNGIKLLGLGEEFYHEILQKFLESQLPKISDFGVLLAKEDWRELNGMAHSMAGTAGNLGLTDLYNQLKSLQLDSKEQKQELCRKHIKDLEGSLSALTEEGERFLRIEP